MQGGLNTRGDELYVAASGKPFTDRAAATMKASLMQSLNDTEYSVVEHGEGWAVKKGAIGIESLTRKTPSTASEPEPPLIANRKPTIIEVARQSKKAEPQSDQKANLLDREKSAQPSTGAVGMPKNNKNSVIVTRPSFKQYPLKVISIVLGFVAVIASQRIGVAVMSMIGNMYPEIITQDRISVAIMGVGGFIALRSLATLFIERYSRKYVVSATAVESYVGIIRRERHIIKFRDIRFVMSRQNTWNRLTNTGNVEMGAAGPSLVDVEFHGIDRPNAMVQRIQMLMDENQRARE